MNKTDEASFCNLKSHPFRVCESAYQGIPLGLCATYFLVFNGIQSHALKGEFGWNVNCSNICTTTLVSIV